MYWLHNTIAFYFIEYISLFIYVISENLAHFYGVRWLGK